MDETGKIAGPGAEFKHSGRRVDVRLADHPPKDIVIRRSDGISFVPNVVIIAVRLFIVVESLAVSTWHNECLTFLDISDPADRLGRNDREVF